MSRISVPILSETGTNLNVTGERFKADGYYGYTDAKMTVGWYFENFVGKISIQATLSLNPTNDDWFTVKFDDETNEIIEYTSQNKGNGLKVWNIKGNFVYIRAIVDRSYIIPAPVDASTLGSVRKVLLNY